MSGNTQSLESTDLSTQHPKHSQVRSLMVGESIETVEKILLGVISDCRASSKVL